jgi:hypothetical protein
VADLSMGLSLSHKFEHLRCESIRLDALTGTPTENDSTLLRRRDVRSDSLAQWISLEFRQPP